MDLTVGIIQPKSRLRESIKWEQEVLPDSRLRLGSDCQVLPLQDALVVRNDLKMHMVKGSMFAMLGGELARSLDGIKTVAEICAGFPPAERTFAVQLINLLKEQGFALALCDDAARDEVLSIPGAEKCIKFLSRLTTRPFEAFARFRHSRVLLVGSGRALFRCVQALLSYRLQHLTVLSLDSSQEAAARLGELARNCDGAVELAIAGAERSARALKHFDLVSYCSSKPSLADLAYLNEACAADTTTFFPGIAFGNSSVIGPFLQPNETGCWVCGLLRLSPEIIDDKYGMMFLESQYSFDPGSSAIEGRMAEIAGGDVAFEIFKWCAGPFRAVLANSVLAQTMDEHLVISAKTVQHNLCGCSRACEREVYSKQEMLCMATADGEGTS